MNNQSRRHKLTEKFNTSVGPPVEKFIDVLVNYNDMSGELVVLSSAEDLMASHLKNELRRVRVFAENQHYPREIFAISATYVEPGMFILPDPPVTSPYASVYFAERGGTMDNENYALMSFVFVPEFDITDTHVVGYRYKMVMTQATAAPE